jgi:bacteriocin biosynthesis cyclodehydratase domain-containing protein
VSIPEQRRALRCLPVDFFQDDSGVRLRRGCLDIRISGDRASEIVQYVLTAADTGASREEICEAFPVSERSSIAELIDDLMRRRILVDCSETNISAMASPESPFEIFCWEFGHSSKSVAARIEEQTIAVAGINEITRSILHVLSEMHAKCVQVIDDPLLRNLRLFDGECVNSTSWNLPHTPIDAEAWKFDTHGCLVACSDFGGIEALNRWNKVCQEHGCHFLPVVLQDLVGYIGPLVVPGETACFECLNARWNSNVEGAEPRRGAVRFEGQHVVGFHPSMATVLGAITAFELCKFYGLEVPFVLAGRLLEINLLTMTMQVRKILRIPRCPVCSNLLKRTSTSSTKSWFGLADTEEP